VPRRPLRKAPPAFLFFGAFAGALEILELVRDRVVGRYGPLHPSGVSPVFEFPETVTYRKSMGTGLLRRFYVVLERWPQDGLAAVKKSAIEMEDEIAGLVAGSVPVERPVNIDPGLINDRRIILATTKDRSHRIYRGGGVWEEVTLVWQDGAYRPLPWTYPDFARTDYHEFFAGFRAELVRGG
jgi:hypothetical protein